MLKRLLEGWPLALVLLFIVCDAASRRPCRNYQYGDKITAHFDPRKCHDLDHARWQCDGVVFDPVVIKGDR